MHTKTEATTTTTYKPSLMERMRGAKTTRATGPANTSTRATRATRATRGTTGTAMGTRGTTTTHSTGVGRRHHNTGTTITPRRQQRKTTLGDKLSGLGMNAKGDATGRPGVKAAGTRRRHGTDRKLKTKKRGLFS